MKYLLIGFIAVLFIAACGVILGIPFGLGFYFFNTVGGIIGVIVGFILVIAFIFWAGDNCEDIMDKLL